MSVYKDNATGKWRVIYRYTDITGKRKQTQKRGFETKREAVAWEHEMMLKAQAKLDTLLSSKIASPLAPPYQWFLPARTDFSEDCNISSHVQILL